MLDRPPLRHVVLSETYQNQFVILMQPNLIGEHTELMGHLAGRKIGELPMLPSHLGFRKTCVGRISPDTLTKLSLPVDGTVMPKFDLIKTFEGPEELSLWKTLIATEEEEESCTSN